MAPGGVEPPPADSKLGPEPRQAETHRAIPSAEAVSADRCLLDLGPSRWVWWPRRGPVMRRRLRASLPSADLLDDLDELVHAVALAAGEGDELPRSLDDSPAFGRPCDRDATPAPELEQSLVAEQP
jgi:hypothetical protein